MTAETLEHVRAWLNTGFLAFLSIIGARFATPLSQYFIRRAELNAQERKEERDGYGPLITALQGEVKRLADGLAKCQEQHEADGRRIATLEAELIGMKRAVITRSTQEVVAIPATAHAQDIADRSARAVSAFPMPDGDMQP